MIASGLSAPLARIKRAVIACIDDNGKIPGAVRTTGKSKTSVGNWHNGNVPDMPTLGDAFALDEVAAMTGAGLPILSAMAHEHNAVVIVLPEVDGGHAELGAQMLTIVKKVGDVSGELNAALHDLETPGEIVRHEAEAIDRQYCELIDAATTGRAILRRQHGLDGGPRGLGAPKAAEG